MFNALVLESTGKFLYAYDPANPYVVLFFNRFFMELFSLFCKRMLL